VIAERAAAEDFVRAFADGWQRPKPDEFLGHFLPRFHPDVRLVQPTLPPARGVAEAEARFRELFALFPDYVVTVDDWAVNGDVVWIGVTHRVRVGGRAADWRGADRVVLEDGLLRERVAFFDSAETLVPALLAPRTWPTLARWNLRTRRGG
jgi:hypothetical protein